jgi:hypothetical protein
VEGDVDAELTFSNQDDGGRCIRSGSPLPRGVEPDRQAFAVCECGNRVKVLRDGTFRRHVPPGVAYHGTAVSRKPREPRASGMSASSAAVVERYAGDPAATLQAVADACGVTRQRVHQILTSYAPEMYVRHLRERQLRKQTRRVFAAIAVAAQHESKRTHGTLNRYRMGCKCKSCRRANADASRARYRVGRERMGLSVSPSRRWVHED